MLVTLGWVARVGISRADSLTLIMRGGGAKGLAYVGAVTELKRFYSFDAFVGTSAGALMAALLGAGISVEELQTQLAKTDFSSFFDAHAARAAMNLLSGKRGLYEGFAAAILAFRRNHVR